MGGVQCTEAIILVLEEKQDGSIAIDSTEDAGFITAWEKARLIRIHIDEGIDPRVRNACAVWLLDARKTARRVFLKIISLGLL